VKTIELAPAKIVRITEGHRSLPWAPTVLHRHSSYHDDPFDAHIAASSEGELNQRMR
jgi:hypothetical protein